MRFLKISILVLIFTFLKIDASEVEVQTIIPESLKVQLEGLDYKLDAFKNLVITLDSPSIEVIAQLQTIIVEIGKSYKNYGLYVYLPIAQGAFSNELEKAGFKFYESNSELKVLIFLYANGRNIPDTNYAYTSAGVCLLRKNPETGTKEILVVNEPQKTIANIIGGYSEKGETPEETAVREIFEEVGIKIKKDNLRLLAFSHTVRADNKKSCTDFYYVCDEFEGTLKADEKEVTEFAWVPLSELLKEGAKVFGKPFYPLFQKFLKGDLRAKKSGERLSPTTRGYQHFNSVEE